MTPAWLVSERWILSGSIAKGASISRTQGHEGIRFSCKFFMYFIVEVNGSTYVSKYVIATIAIPHCMYPTLYIWNNTPEWQKLEPSCELSFLSPIHTNYHEQSSPSTVLKILRPNLNTRFKAYGNYSNVKLNLKAPLHHNISLVQQECKIGYIKISLCLTLLHHNRQETLPPRSFQLHVPTLSSIWFRPPLLPHQTTCFNISNQITSPPETPWPLRNLTN